MSRLPIILAVDDEPPVLASVTRDLRKRYAKDYRILGAPSGAVALDTLQRLHDAGDPVALIICDQRMPDLEGTALLARAAPLAPSAKTVLLTAYADTQAAIDAINEVGLDHYLLKPWDPPEERLYPVLDDLLADWRRSTYLPWDGIRVYGAAWSARAHEIRTFLARQRIPFRYIDVDLETPPPGVRVPTVQMPDGELIVDPDPEALAARVGLRTEADHAAYDLVVIGAGPAGLAAAVYAAAEGLHCLVIEKGEVGGLASTSPRIENYLGFPSGIAGADLTRRAHDQANRLGAEILSMHEVKRIRVAEPYRIIELTDGTELTASAVVIATGAQFRTLPATGAEQFHGVGVFYACTHSDLPHFVGKRVHVIGGGNSAAQAALLLSRTAAQVTMLVRGAPAIASQYLLDAIEANPKVELRLNAEVSETRGSDRLDALVIDGAVEPSDGLFVFVGVRPSSELVADLCLRNDRGFLLTGPQLGGRPKGWPLDRDPLLLETSTPGIFAAGDVRQGTIGRVAWAAAEGGACVTMVLEYLRGWKTGSRGAAES